MTEDTGFLSRWSRRKVQAQKGPEALAAEPAGQRLENPAAAAPAQPAVSQKAPQAQPPGPLQARQPPPAVQAVASAAAPPAAPASASQAAAPPTPPPPTLDDALALTPQTQDFSRFVGRGVDPQVRHTALKTLFSDPHFNVMDRLDTYIDDYNTPDPLPPGMLRQMVQSSMLGLFDDEGAKAAKPVAAPHDAAGPGQETVPAEPDAEIAPGNTAIDAVPGPPQPADGTAALQAAPSPQDTPPDHEDPAVRLQPNDDAGSPRHQPGPGPDAGGQR